MGHRTHSIHFDYGKLSFVWWTFSRFNYKHFTWNCHKSFVLNILNPQTTQQPDDTSAVHIFAASAASESSVDWETPSHSAHFTFIPFNHFCIRLMHDTRVGARWDINMIHPLTNKFISFQEFHVSRSLALVCVQVISAKCAACSRSSCSSAFYSFKIKKRVEWVQWMWKSI